MLRQVTINELKAASKFSQNQDAVRLFAKDLVKTNPYLFSFITVSGNNSIPYRFLILSLKVCSKERKC